MLNVKIIGNEKCKNDISVSNDTRFFLSSQRKTVAEVKSMYSLSQLLDEDHAFLVPSYVLPWLW